MASSSASPLIQIKELTRQFTRGEAKVQALAGVDLTIQQGEFVALVGPSGSGKSTLLNALGGLDTPSGGELWLDGVALHQAKEAEQVAHRRHRVGFIFQSFNLLPRWTAVENVATQLMLSGVNREERETRAQTLLERVGLGHRLTHYPAEMSGGEQQRTAVARALIHNPSLILADEPTGNLDSKTGDEVMGLLRQLNREEGITLIVVTHDEEVANYADRIVRMKDGKIQTIVDNRQTADTLVEPAEASQKQPTETGQPDALNAHLTFADIMRNSLQNLRRRPVRNLLTAAGVLIGIVTLVAMVSFGVGVQQEVQRNFESIGLENIIVNPQYEEVDVFDPFARPVPVRPITPEVIAELEADEDVLSVTPFLGLPNGLQASLQVGEDSFPIRFSFGDLERQFGLGEADDMRAGEEFLASGVTSGIILPTGLADQLLVDGAEYDSLLGQTIDIRVQLPRGEFELFPTTIVGVRQAFNDRVADLAVDDKVAIKAWWFDEPDILQIEGYDGLVVQARSLGVVSGLQNRLEDQALDPQSLEAILDIANQVLGLLQALLGSVGGLALLVAALGVANTMMMAIYERTREIGVLKALGATSREIRRLFTVEAGLIGLIGGIFGLIFGTLLGQLVDWIAHRYLIAEGITGIGSLSVVPLWLAGGALTFAALIGILAGLYPASRAAKLDPVTALRHD